MSEIPTKWAIIEFGWGEGNRHIYSFKNWDIGYYETEDEARDAARTMIQQGNAKMMAILEVKALIAPKPLDFLEVV